MYKICESYEQNIRESVVECEQALSGVWGGKEEGRRRSFPSFPSHPGSPGRAFSQAIWCDSLWILSLRPGSFSKSRCQLPLLLNCFVNLAPLGLYFSLIFSLMPKTIHKETQPKLVQQTNMRNWRTCVWSRKSKWFVILEVPDYVTRKKLTIILDRKCWKFCTFLPTEQLSPGFSAAMTPPLAPTWSKLFSQDQKWCSRTSRLFLFPVEGRVFVVASAFKSFILKLDMVTSIFLNILVLLSFSPLIRARAFSKFLSSP